MDPQSELNQSPTTIQPPAEVTYQTLIWILINLSCSTMAQPCGSVLNQPTYLRIFLRGSPIICIADTLSIPLNLFHLHFKHPRVRLSSSMRLLVNRRFESAGHESVKELRYMTFARWMFFILGPMGPTIKLMGMSGVPWTKTWGVFLGVSFVVMEGIVAFGPTSSWKTVTSEPGYDEEHGQIAFRQFHIDAGPADEFMFGAAIRIHLSILFVAVLILWSEDLDRFPDWVLDAKNAPRLSKCFLTFQMLSWQSFSLLFIAVSSFVLVTAVSKVVRSEETIWSILGPLILFGATWFIIIYYEAIKMLMFGSLLIVGIPCLHHYGFTIFLRGTCREVPFLRGYLHPMSDDDDDDDWFPTYIFWFLMSLVVTILWYAFEYNPSGTVNPEWTSNFG